LKSSNKNLSSILQDTSSVVVVIQTDHFR
jgi:hypothetical protein